MGMSTTLSIVVPCHDEEATLRSFHDELARALAGLDVAAEEIEIVFVDDGSDDGTLDVIRALVLRDPRVRYLALSRNFGKESALYAGLAAARGAFVCTMDADLQDPPELLGCLFEAVASGRVDIARTRRVDRKGEPILRSVCARAFYAIMRRFASVDVADGARDYQMMRRACVDALLEMGEYSRFYKGMTSWIGFRVEWFEYPNAKRAKGESSWSFCGLARYAIESLVDFTTAPLMLAATLGIVCFLLAVLMIVFVVVRAAIFGDPVAGWPSTICIILLIGGVQLLCIGILGQYLSKTYLQAKRRPIYLVRTAGPEEGAHAGSCEEPPAERAS